ncbi:MAG: AAA family ATPase [Mycoplasmatales bacterium]
MIKKISIDNFKSFKHGEFEFNDNLNLIYGNNGDGKTTVIDIIKFINSVFKYDNINELLRTNITTTVSENEIFFSNDNKLNLYEEYSSLGKDKNVYLNFEMQEKNSLYKYELELSKNDMIIKEKLSKGKKVFFEKIDTGYKVSNDIKGFYKTYIDTINVKDRSIISSINSILSKRTVDEKLITKDLERVMSIFDKFFYTTLRNASSNKYLQIDHYLPNLISSHYRINAKDLERFKNNQKDILEQFINFLIDIDNNILDAFFEYKKEGEYYNATLFLKKSYKGDEYLVPFDKESSGTKKYIELFNILTMQDEYNTIAIDEIDLHLHDNLQEKIINYISNKSKMYNTQYILTTHNTSSLNNINLNNKNKLLLQRDYDNNVTLKNLSGYDVKENNQSKYLNGVYGEVINRSDLFIDQGVKWSL